MICYSEISYKLIFGYLVTVIMILGYVSVKLL